MLIVSHDIMGITGKGAVNKLIVVNIGLNESHLEERFNLFNIREHHQKIQKTLSCFLPIERLNLFFVFQQNLRANGKRIGLIQQFIKQYSKSRFPRYCPEYYISIEYYFLT